MLPARSTISRARGKSSEQGVGAVDRRVSWRDGIDAARDRMARKGRCPQSGQIPDSIARDKGKTLALRQDVVSCVRRDPLRPADPVVDERVEVPVAMRGLEGGGHLAAVFGVALDAGPR